MMPGPKVGDAAAQPTLIPMLIDPLPSCVVNHMPTIMVPMGKR